MYSQDDIFKVFDNLKKEYDEVIKYYDEDGHEIYGDVDYASKIYSLTYLLEKLESLSIYTPIDNNKKKKFNLYHSSLIQNCLNGNFNVFYEAMDNMLYSDIVDKKIAEQIRKRAGL